ncbi:MAG: hypothetical protein H6807_02730 [Planctomycetes bacterium]|nr:hypothetical protein [Planctomycetota bacterium]
MSEDNKEVDASLGLFEAALRAQKTTLELPRVEEVVLFLDGSDQDPTAGVLARALADRLGARLGIHEPPLGDDAAANVDRFRAAAAGAAVLVLPVPFGEDIGDLKSESLSSSVDLALAELDRPLLLVRQALAEPERSLARPVCLLDWHEDLQGAAASWSALLAGRDGEISLRIGHDPELIAEVRAIFDDHADDLATFESMLQRAESRVAGGLVAALQRLGEERGFAIDFAGLGGTDLVGAVLALTQARDRIAVAAHRRHESSSASRVRDLILRSRGPVLVIPG